MRRRSRGRNLASMHARLMGRIWCIAKESARQFRPSTQSGNQSENAGTRAGRWLAPIAKSFLIALTRRGSGPGKARSRMPNLSSTRPPPRPGIQRVEHHRQGRQAHAAALIHRCQRRHKARRHGITSKLSPGLAGQSGGHGPAQGAGACCGGKALPNSWTPPAKKFEVWPQRCGPFAVLTAEAMRPSPQ